MTLGVRLHSCEKPNAVFQSTVIMSYNLNYRFSCNIMMCLGGEIIFIFVFGISFTNYFDIGI